jgi:transposase/quinol monooxygenase YgiN
MIVRVFRARTRPGMRGAYAQLARDRGLPLMRAEPGCLHVRIGEVPGQPDELTIVSVWKDLESLKAFAGEMWQEVVILPGEAELLVELTVAHYDDSYRSLRALRRTSARVLGEREAKATRTPRLTDAQWEQLRAVLPPANREGRPRANNRRTLEGILYVLRTGCRWHDLPREYGSPVTCWRRFSQWEADGTWERIWAILFASLTTPEKLAWTRAFLRPGSRADRGTGRQSTRHAAG